MTVWSQKENSNIRPYFLRRHEQSIEKNCLILGRNVVVSEVHIKKMDFIHISIIRLMAEYEQKKLKL